MILNKKGRVGRLNVSLLYESQDSGGGRKEFLVQVEPIVRSRGGFSNFNPADKLYLLQVYVDFISESLVASRSIDP